MKKILFFRPLFSLGGTEIAILNLIKRLENYEIFVAYSDETSDKHLLKRFSPYAKVINLNEIDKIEIDYFIPASAHYNLDKEVNKIKSKKTILWIHHLINIETTILADKEKMKNIDCVLTVSKTTANILKSLFPEQKKKIKTIYNVINDEEIIKQSKEPITLPLAKDLNLVTVARVCKEKGFLRMLELAKALVKEKINFKWFIVGDNYYKDQVKEIYNKFKEFKDYFVWFGFIDNPHNIVKQCDYEVLLSDDETWGLVLTEAMILNVPCISGDFPVAFEQIKDKENGVILKNLEPDTYIDRVQDIVKNKTKYKNAVKNYKYNNKEIIKKWDELLNEKY